MTSVIEVCLGISGQFEGGHDGPRYTLVSGNHDKQGISCGALQWCAGQGSLQNLLKRTLGGYPVADDHFAPIFALKDMKPAQAVAYAVQQWGDPTSTRGDVTKEARALWGALLGTPQCIAAQNTLAQEILDRALAEAAKFLPWIPDAASNLRIAAFFFDLHVQQGGLSKKMKDGTRQPKALASASQAALAVEAIALAASTGKATTARAWQAALDSGDPLVAPLLHYAIARARLGRADYLWDTLSRRGTIACRAGAVHGAWFDFTKVLP